MKKILKITGFVILGFFLLLLIIPIFFKGAIVEAVRTELNKELDATVQFEDVKLSFIRNFPNLNLRLYDLSVTGENEFEGHELLRAEQLGLVFNLSSLWKKDQPYELKSLNIDGMNLHMVTLSNGKTNYMILKESEIEEVPDSDLEDSDFAFDLNAYRISNSRILWDDKSTNTLVQMLNFNHSGRGNFTADQFEWGSQTDIEETFVSYGGVKYLSGVPVDWDISLEVDMVENSLKIVNNSLLINLLQLDLQGMILFPENENLYLDLAINAPGNDFVELFSVLPIAAMADMDDLEVRGDFDFSAFAKGEYNGDEERYPPFGFDLKVTDGFVQYPDMDIPIENIFIDLNGNSPTSDLDQMVVDISAFSLKMSANPIAGKLHLSKMISDPRVVGDIDGRIDLGDINRVFPLEGVNKLAGQIVANLNAAFNWSDIDNENYDQITLSGLLNVNQVDAEMDDMPAIRIPYGGVELRERTTKIQKTRLVIGSSDFEAEGETNNILKLWGSQSPLTGQINLRSTHLDVDELMNLFAAAEEDPIVDLEVESPKFFNVNIDIKADAQKVIFRPYFISDISSDVNLQPHLMTLQNTSLVINESDLSGNAVLENWYAFAMADERLTVDANLKSGVLDLDKLMDYEEPGSQAATPNEQEDTGTATVPDFKYNIHLNGQANKVIYRPYELENVTTRAYITERDLHIEQFAGRIYGDQLEGEGFIGNYMRYVYLDEVLTGELSFRAPSLDVNKWMEAMTAEETGASESEVDLDEMEPFKIPQNLDMAITGKVGKMDYFNMPFREVSGLIEMVDGALQIKDFTGNLFRGKMVVNGLYETTSENPFLNMKLDIESLDIPTSFRYINTLAAIGPLFEFMNGQFNSSVALNTRLGSGMMPLWNTFNAEGFIKTLNAQINDFPALSKAADQLQLDFLRKLKLDDIENWFQVKDGRFELKPVSHTIEDTDFEFSGNHLIAGDMNYLLEASIPKELIGRSTVGAGAVKGLDFLQSEASKLGVNIGGGSHVDVGIRLTGKLKNPGVAIELLGVSTGKTAGEQVEDSVRDRVEEERDKVEERVEKEIEETRKEVEERVKKELDSLRDIAGANEEELRKKERELREKAQKEAEDLLKDMQKDTTGKDVEDIKDRIKKFNPFKKGGDGG
nr:AsmA family protein [Saprospiraceae bacterium]